MKIDSNICRNCAKENADLNLTKLFVYRKDNIRHCGYQQPSAGSHENDSLREMCINIFKTFLVIVLPFVLFTGCENKNTPERTAVVLNSNFTEPVEIINEELFKIDSLEITNPVNIIFDSNENMYIVQYDSEVIKIFDKYGKFINNLKFENKISFFNIFQDTAFVKLSRDNTLKKTDLKGNVISEKQLTGYYPVDIEPFGSGYIGTFRKSLSVKSDMYTEFSLNLVDKDFNVKKVISSVFDSYFSGNIDLETSIFPFASDNEGETIFISYSSSERYTIFVFDGSLDLRFVIENDLPPVRVSQEETAKRKENAKRFRLPYFENIKHKNFIESIQTGPENEFLVRRAHNTNIYGINSAIYDIFSKNGKYIKSVKIPHTNRIGAEIFRNGRLCIIRPFGSEVSVYSLNSISEGDRR